MLKGGVDEVIFQYESDLGREILLKRFINHPILIKRHDNSRETLHSFPFFRLREPQVFVDEIR